MSFGIKRREFCKLAAAAAATTILPEHARGEDLADSPAFRRYDTYTEDYAAFCAKAPEQRVFYVLEDGALVPQKLNERTWQTPPAHHWGPPSIPVPGGSREGVPVDYGMAGLAGDGPYKATWDSLMQYDAPEWYKDAKFGIWAHWSPQCVAEAGDWYAQQMYIQGSPAYNYHVQRFGHPSKFGYKEICAQWTLLNWDPDALIERFRKAGAKFFFALANHHDGFDTWDSRHQPWNSINVGPRRDVIREWAAAARKQGLRFGVDVHQARNWWWFQFAHSADQTGPLAGVPYDGHLNEADGKGQWWEGLNPQQLYAPKHPMTALPDISYAKNFYDRTRDLIDQHDPDLLYFDDSLFPLGWAGLTVSAYYYNHILKTRGKMEGIVNIKHVPDDRAKSVIADYERGLTAGIMPYPWQSETCIGHWHYDRKLFDRPGEYGGYMHPRDVVHWLIDTVSKNGTFVLSVPGKPDGTLDSKEIAVLDGITEWMGMNGEAIYATRPWTVYGEGPDTVESGAFQGNSVTKLSAKDIRFTRNKAGNVVYAIVLGWPTQDVIVRSLGTASATKPGKVEHIELLGTDARVDWKQTDVGLKLQTPASYHPAVDFAAAFKITLA